MISYTTSTIKTFPGMSQPTISLVVIIMKEILMMLLLRHENLITPKLASFPGLPTVQLLITYSFAYFLCMY